MKGFCYAAVQLLIYFKINPIFIRLEIDLKFYFLKDTWRQSYWLLLYDIAIILHRYHNEQLTR